MSLIFISYRRRDSSDATGRLYDRLLGRFPSDAVFMDIDGISPGVDFHGSIKAAIAGAHVMLVVIGNDWVEACDESGNLRLHDPEDYVRIEIEAALDAGLVVIPVLVREGRMPTPEKLPATLHPLLKINATEVRSGHNFEDHFAKLVRAIEKHLTAQGAPASAGFHPDPDLRGGRGEPASGVCPDCGCANRPDRKFCGQCRRPMREPCLECDFENGSGDVFCGGCSKDLKKLLESKLSDCNSRRRRVETAVEELRFDDGLRTAEGLAGETHFRLRTVANWASEQLSKLQAVRADWAARVAAWDREAADCILREDFEGAVVRLQEIPPPLRSPEQKQRIVEAAAAAEQALLAAAERRRLRAAVEQEIHADDLTKVVPSLNRYLQAGADKAEVRALAEPWIRRVAESLERCCERWEFATAVDVGQLVPEPLRDVPLIEALSEATRCRQDWAAASDDFKRAWDLKELRAAFNALEKMLRIAPGRAETLALVPPVVDYARKKAEEHLENDRLAAAVAALDVVPEAYCDDAMQRRRDELRENARVYGELEDKIRGRPEPKTVREAVDLLDLIDRYRDVSENQARFATERERVVERLLLNACRCLLKGDSKKARLILEPMPASLTRLSLRDCLLRLAEQSLTSTGVLSQPEPTTAEFEVLDALCERDVLLEGVMADLADKILTRISAAARRHGDAGEFAEAIALFDQIPSPWSTSDHQHLRSEFRAKLKARIENQQWVLRTVRGWSSAAGVFREIVEQARRAPNGEVIRPLLDALNERLPPIAASPLVHLRCDKQGRLHFVDQAQKLRSFDPDAATSTELGTLPLAASSLTVHPDLGHLIVGYVDGSIGVWEPSPDSANADRHRTIIAAADSLCAVTVAGADWHAVVRAAPTTLVYAEAARNTQQTLAVGHPVEALHIVVEEHDLFVVYGDSQRRLRIWQPGSTDPTSWFSPVCRASIIRLAAVGGVFYAGCRDGAVYQFRAFTSASAPADLGLLDELFESELPPTQRRRRRMRWHISPKTKLLAAHDGPVTAIEPAVDRPRLLTAGEDRTVRLWDCTSGRLLQTFYGHEAPVRCLAIFPGGDFAVSGDDAGRIRWWWIGE